MLNHGTMPLLVIGKQGLLADYTVPEPFQTDVTRSWSKRSYRYRTASLRHRLQTILSYRAIYLIAAFKPKSYDVEIIIRLIKIKATYHLFNDLASGDSSLLWSNLESQCLI
jgi:hypothetical protein